MHVFLIGINIMEIWRISQFQYDAFNPIVNTTIYGRRNGLQNWLFNYLAGTTFTFRIASNFGLFTINVISFFNPDPY